ncbi:plasma membrane ATPase 4-like [Salvia splendens]|uniref:plasma membrane ATPase 4-like n=1 Tax=Salvia splendens TaxID=180675 RepID=UPI001C26149B|nr:plasma membrane ATPase 4-like [Salvia splendens]
MKKISLEPKPLILLMQPLLMTVVCFLLMHESDFFPVIFGVKSMRHNDAEMMSALYLQVSIVSQAIVFVTNYLERPGMLLVCAFVVAQLVATLIAVYVDWSFAKVKGCGWGWAVAIWIYSAMFYGLLDLIKFSIRYIVRQNLHENKVRMYAFLYTTQIKDFDMEEIEARWAHAQRAPLHGLNQPEEASISNNIFNENNNHTEMSEIASGITEQAKKLAEIARLHELHVLKGKSSQSWARH